MSNILKRNKPVIAKIQTIGLSPKERLNRILGKIEYDDEYALGLIELAEKGYHPNYISSYSLLPVSILEKWKKSQPSFKNAYEIALQIQKDYWQDKMMLVLEEITDNQEKNIMIRAINNIQEISGHFSKNAASDLDSVRDRLNRADMSGALTSDPTKDSITQDEYFSR